MALSVPPTHDTDTVKLVSNWGSCTRATALGGSTSPAPPPLPLTLGTRNVGKVALKVAQIARAALLSFW